VTRAAAHASAYAIRSTPGQPIQGLTGRGPFLRGRCPRPPRSSPALGPLHALDVARLPALVDRCFGRPVEPQNGEILLSRAWSPTSLPACPSAHRVPGVRGPRVSLRDPVCRGPSRHAAADPDGIAGRCVAAGAGAGRRSRRRRSKRRAGVPRAVTQHRLGRRAAAQAPARTCGGTLLGATPRHAAPRGPDNAQRVVHRHAAETSQPSPIKPVPPQSYPATPARPC